VTTHRPTRQQYRHHPGANIHDDKWPKWGQIR
jgi:hypothetical protein